MPNTDMELREVALVARAHKAEPAPGLVVDRPLPSPELDVLDPFLMLDHFGPDVIRPGDGGGLNPHPHRGFETVTVMLEGAMEHRDSQGNRGVIRPGDVQWMTAARGIVHVEYRERELVRQGGRLQGIQLWVNLPRQFKMHEPGYQDLGAARIPSVELTGGTVRIIAGEYATVRGPARTFTPLALLHVALRAGAQAGIPLAADWNAGVYVISGRVQTGGRTVAERSLAVLEPGGRTIRLQAQTDAELLVLAGKPIGEPIVSWGPFVMSTRGEIMQAQRDYALGRMGVLDPHGGA